MKTPDTSSILRNVVSRFGKAIHLSEEFQADMFSTIVTGYDVTFHVQGDFTTVVMSTKNVDDEHRQTFVGVSKRNPEDRSNPLRGKALALARAARLVTQHEYLLLATKSATLSAPAGIVSAVTNLFNRAKA